MKFGFRSHKNKKLVPQLVSNEFSNNILALSGLIVHAIPCKKIYLHFTEWGNGVVVDVALLSQLVLNFTMKFLFLSVSVHA